jgi:hypothetical protein
METYGIFFLIINTNEIKSFNQGKFEDTKRVIIGCISKDRQYNDQLIKDQQTRHSNRQTPTPTSQTIQW